MCMRSLANGSNCIFGLFLTDPADVAHSVLHLHQVVVACFLRKLQHFLFERGNEVLRMRALVSDEFQDALKVDGVQSCINFVEHVENGRLAFLKRHQHTKSKHTLLPPWKLVPTPRNLPLCLKRHQNRQGCSKFNAIPTSLLVSFEPHIRLASSDSPKNSREVHLELVEYNRSLFVFLSLAIIDHSIQTILYFKHLVVLSALFFKLFVRFGQLVEQKLLFCRVKMPFFAMKTRKTHTERIRTLLHLLKLCLNCPQFT